MWILIFYACTIWSTQTMGTSFSQEFKTQQACFEARDILLRKDGVKAVFCVKDGSQ